MGNLNLFLDSKRNVSDYSQWPIHNEGFDRSFSPLYFGHLTTCCVLDRGKKAARFLSVHGPFKYHGWKNLEQSKNVGFLENAFEIAQNLNEIQKKDWRVNIPKPHGLFLINQRPFNSLHPAFVMDYIPNHYFSQDPDKKIQIQNNKEEMLKVLEKEYNFDTGISSRENNNFIYNQDLEKIYLIGFSLWNKK